MATYLNAFSGLFWSEWFWCPPGIQWKDFESTESSIYYPRFKDMHYSLIVGFLLLFIRFVYETLIVVPIARGLGVKETKRSLVPNPILEKMFRKNKGKVSNNEIPALSKQTDWTERQIQLWFHQRRLANSPTAMQRFRECSWHLLFYSTSVFYTLYILWDKPWLWNTRYCWDGWPKLTVTNEVFILYLVELGFYWSLVFTLLTDHARKDFWEMTVHHIVTILLIYFSWAANFVRIGTLVLLVHDVADTWMASAKMAKYSRHQTLCEFLFAIFMVVWTVSRLYAYPFWVLNSSVFESHDFVDHFPAYWLFNGLLSILLCLHCIWTVMIYRIAFQKITHGNLQKDVRSDTESEDDSAASDESDKKITRNCQRIERNT